MDGAPFPSLDTLATSGGYLQLRQRCLQQVVGSVWRLGEILPVLPNPSSIREQKQSTSPAAIIVLQGGGAELPQITVAWLGGQSLTRVHFSFLRGRDSVLPRLVLNSSASALLPQAPKPLGQQACAAWGDLFLFMCASLLICMCTHVCAGRCLWRPEERWMPQNWSYRQLRATLWVQGTELDSTASVPKH